MSSDSPIKINLRYVLVTALAVLLSWLLHELAHWVIGESIGYRMGMRLNSCFPLSGKFDSGADYQLVSAAGPVFTLLEAFLVFFLLMNKPRPLLLPFLFTCFYMRFFAFVISVLNPNDEARISQYLGIGKYTLPAAVTLLLLALVWIVVKKYRPGYKFLLANLGLVVLFSSVIIIVDMKMGIRVL
jgi:hypothetical protein